MPKTTAVDKMNKKALSQPKERAVELWRTTRGHITNICSALDISRTTFYNWLERDKDFAQAIADAEAELNDDVRDALIQKIADGDTPAIKYYLDRRHPDFRPQANTQVAIQVNTIVGDDRAKFR